MATPDGPITGAELDAMDAADRADVLELVRLRSEAPDALTRHWCTYLMLYAWAHQGKRRGKSEAAVRNAYRSGPVGAELEAMDLEDPHAAEAFVSLAGRAIEDAYAIPWRPPAGIGEFVR
jgi:hypothetical protein